MAQVKESGAVEMAWHSRDLDDVEHGVEERKLRPWAQLGSLGHGRGDDVMAMRWSSLQGRSWRG